MFIQLIIICVALLTMHIVTKQREYTLSLVIIFNDSRVSVEALN